MLGKMWAALAPFHRSFGWFLILVTLYESLKIAEGYLNSLVIRLFDGNAQIVVWAVLTGVLLIYDELFMRFDNRLDWHVVSRQGFPMFKHLKLTAIAKFLEMNIGWHQKHNSGALVGKVANGAAKVNEVIDILSWDTMPTIIQTILSVVPLVFLSGQTALIAVVAFVVFLWMTFKSIEEKKAYRKKRYDLYEDEWHLAIESVQGVETLQMFGQAERYLAEIEAKHDGIIESGLTECRIGIFKYNRWRIRLLTVARRLVLLIWVSQLYNGSMDIANFIFVSSLTEKLFSSFWRFSRIFDHVSEAIEPTKRLVDVYNEKSEIKTGGKEIEISGPVGITMENVNFAYCKEYNADDGVLHDVSLEIPPGKIVAIVGPSGAGKTTIRRLVTGLYKAQSGNITVGGLPVSMWDEKALRRLFSYVPQGDDVTIFAKSIKDNILLARCDATFEEVVEASQLSGIHDFITSLPQGYDTQLGEKGKRLSGGQKQRVALDRAIIANRPVLFLDEATSALDSINEAKIQKELKRILAGKTAIIVAHRLSTIWDIADKIVVMDQGRVVEEGTHQELIKLNGLYAQMVALQTAEN